MFTLYQMASNGDGNISGINDATFMASYWAQVKLMYQKIGATGQPTLVNLEPDFWGYVLATAPGGDPTKLPARVSMTAECASQPDSAAGLAGCLLTLGRTYAPKAKIGFPPSFFWKRCDHCRQLHGESRCRQGRFHRGADERS